MIAANPVVMLFMLVLFFWKGTLKTVCSQYQMSVGWVCASTGMRKNLDQLTSGTDQ